MYELCGTVSEEGIKDVSAGKIYRRYKREDLCVNKKIIKNAVCD